jgi:ComF family protein
MFGLVSVPPLSRLATAAVDILLPPRCLSCGAAATAAGTLCAECWRAITFLDRPCCACCGLPFDFELGESALCGDCAREPPRFDRARSAMRYDEASRKLILAFKHGDRLHLAPAFGQWLKRAGAELLRDADLIVPVPLHWTRLFARRYNQAALLARALAAQGGPPMAPDWLIRKRRTPSQGRQSAVARRRNVAGAFAMRPGKSIAGLRVVLIDDVLTTGATVSECARILKRAGAKRVDVLTLARTVREHGA